MLLKFLENSMLFQEIIKEYQVENVAKDFAKH